MIIMELKWPKKPKRLNTETEQQFLQRVSEYVALKKEWHKEYRKRRYIERPEEKEKYRRTPEEFKVYYLNNAEKLKNRYKLYREKNPEKIKSKSKNYYELKKQDPEWMKQKRAAALKRFHERKLNDKDFVLKKTLRDSLRNNIRKYLTKKTNSALDLIGCSTEDFISHIEKQFQPEMSWNPKNFHLDHIRPVSSFDLTDPEQLKQCFHYTNYQPLWPLDNLKKGAKHVSV